jgi:ATP-dependent Clp protease protease subunit
MAWHTPFQRKAHAYSKGKLTMSVHYVAFSAEVNPSTTENLIAVMGNLSNNSATEVNLLLSSPGGSVLHGITIYNVLRALPIKIITWNMGNVDSIGNVIFLAGEERYACPNSTFMFHGVGFDAPSGVRFDEQLVRERLGAIEADHKRIGAILEQRTGLQTGDVLELFKEARTKDAAWAQSVGVSHATREPQIPQGVPVHSLVFNR